MPMRSDLVVLANTGHRGLVAGAGGIWAATPRLCFAFLEISRVMDSDTGQSTRHGYLFVSWDLDWPDEGSGIR
jgi:hypothetical protein